MDCCFPFEQIAVFRVQMSNSTDGEAHFTIPTMSHCSPDRLSAHYHLFFCLSPNKDSCKPSASAMHHKLGFTGTYGLVKSEEDRSLKAPSCNSQDSNNLMPGSRDTPTGLVAMLQRMRAALPTNY